MPFWSFEYIVLNFPRYFKANQTYGQSLEILNKNVAVKPGDQKLLLESVQALVPGYTITEQDEAQRESRREISEIARSKFFKLTHKLTSMKSYSEENLSLERGIDLIFDVSDDPSAEAHNQQARFLFTKEARMEQSENGGKTIYSYPNGDIKARTELIKARLDQLFQTDFSKMYTMTDREIAENFDKLYPVYILLVEGGDNLVGFNKRLFDLPQSYIDKMKELKWEHQGIFVSIKNRFGCILNPNYEIFHYERMKPEEDRMFDNAGDYGREDLGDRIGASDDARAFLDTLDNFCTYNKGSFVDRINHEIRKLNLPEEMLLPPETDGKGARIASPLLKVFLPGNGVQIPTEDLVKGFDMVCFTNPATGQTHFLKYDGFNYQSVDMSLLPEPLRSEPDKLMKALDNADPWYIRIFTGSKQFDEMKKAMKVVQELKDEMGLSPTKEQREEMANRLSTLTEKANAYLLEKKGGIQMDSSDAERARITAAERLLEYSLEGRALLVGYEQAHAFKAKAHDAAFAANNEGMKEQAKEEEGFARPREFTKPAHLYTQEQAEKQKQEQKQGRSLGGFWAAQDTKDMKVQLGTARNQKKRAAQQADQDVREFYNKGFAKDDPLAGLAREIYDMRGLGDDGKLNRGLRTARIARMVTLDIILRERQGQGEGVVGPIEELYRGNPQVFVKTLENSAQLKKIGESIDAKDLRDMMRATSVGGIQQLTNKILKEQGLELPKPQQPQLQQVAQNQPKAPEAPEPPKANIPNVMG